MCIGGEKCKKFVLYKRQVLKIFLMFKFTLIFQGIFYIITQLLTFLCYVLFCCLVFTPKKPHLGLGEVC